jgi:hypothetical protein
VAKVSLKGKKIFLLTPLSSSEALTGELERCGAIIEHARQFLDSENDIPGIVTQISSTSPDVVILDHPTLDLSDRLGVVHAFVDSLQGTVPVVIHDDPRDSARAFQSLRHKGITCISGDATMGWIQRAIENAIGRHGARGGGGPSMID